MPTGETDLTYATHEITISVTRGYRGTAEGETIVTNARIPIPGQPVMCPQFPQDLEGKYVLLGLRADDTGALRADAWDMLYMSDSRPSANDPGYAEAVKYAELAADNSPARPVLLLAPPDVACGEQITFTGMRFPPGEYVVMEAFGRVLGTFNVGPMGILALTVPALFGQCLSDTAGTFPAWIEVYPVSNTDPYVAELGPLAELALVTVTNQGDGEIGGPVLAISDGTPFFCGANVTVVGQRFMAEPLTIMFEGAAPSTSVMAYPPPHGRTFGFSAQLTIPAGACDASLAAITVYQAGFERFGRPLARIYVETRQAPPGPPDVGNSSNASPDQRPWLAVAGLAMALLATAGWSMRSRT